MIAELWACRVSCGHLDEGSELKGKSGYSRKVCPDSKGLVCLRCCSHPRYTGLGATLSASPGWKLLVQAH